MLWGKPGISNLVSTNAEETTPMSTSPGSLLMCWIIRDPKYT